LAGRAVEGLDRQRRRLGEHSRQCIPDAVSLVGQLRDGQGQFAYESERPGQSPAMLGARRVFV
jgi:hypothetical protein